MKHGKLRLPLVAAAVVLLSTGMYMAARLDTAPGAYTPLDKEFYLTPEQLLFIRPGLDLEILEVEIPGDRKPLVTFSLTDPPTSDHVGMPLDIDGVFTPGVISVRFNLTYTPQGERQRVNIHPRTRDRNGVFTEIGDGLYTYKFEDSLPEDWDPDANYTLAGAARRDLGEFDLGRYVDNAFHHFVPSGSSEPMPRDVVRIATCNKCHDPLAMHGSRYIDVQMCMQCHTPQLVDDGVSYSFNVLIHRVHKELEDGFPVMATIQNESAGVGNCQVCHVGGTPTADFPLVADPNPVPVCDSTGSGSTKLAWNHSGPVEIRVGSPTGKLVAKAGREGSLMTGKWVNDETVLYLIDAGSGEVVQRMPVNTTVLGCVGNPPGAMIGEAASDHTAWLTYPSRTVCGSCHDHVNFETGEGHSIGLPQPNDDFCSTCHPGTRVQEYDTSIPGAHTVDFKSAQLGGVLIQVKSVTNAAPGQKPTVRLSLSNKYGPLDPAKLGRLRLVITGPNTDYSYYLREDALGKLSPKGGDWTYTFEEALPATAEGSYSLSFEARIEDVVINEGRPNEFVRRRDPAQNYVFPFAVTDDSPMARRSVVADMNCEGCHSNLSLHGNNRHNPDYCVTCHRPDATYEEEGDPPAGIAFKYMVHKIHRGEDLQYPYEVEGHEFNHVEYPGDLRNCERCHVNDSYELPLPKGLLPTETPGDFYTPMEPIAGACLACHDGEATASHAIAQTTFLGESCENCHGETKDYAVSRVHAR